MSTATTQNLADRNADASGPVRPASRASAYVSAVVLVGMLAASGVLRLWQDRRMDAAAAAVATASIPLKELPATIGHWKARGGDHELDAQTVRIAGCTSYLARNYADDRTGAALTVLVAFGPAEKLFSHTPLVCFPSTGYAMEGGINDLAVPLGAGAAFFRSAVFAKPGALGEDRQEALYSFRHGGVWTPDASASYKRFRHEPAMYKVQVERRVGRQELRDQSSPSVEFLSALLPEIEARIKASEAPGPPPK